MSIHLDPDINSPVSLCPSVLFRCSNMSLKERLDKKTRKYMHKLSTRDTVRKRNTTSSLEVDEPLHQTPLPAPTKKDKVDKGEKEVWKYEGESNSQGEVDLLVFPLSLSIHFSPPPPLQHPFSSLSLSSIPTVSDACILVSDQYDGVGRLSNTQTNEFYEGQWRGGKRHGFGTQLFVTGERYQGAWKEGNLSPSLLCVSSLHRTHGWHGRHHLSKQRQLHRLMGVRAASLGLLDVQWRGGSGRRSLH